MVQDCILGTDTRLWLDNTSVQMKLCCCRYPLYSTAQCMKCVMNICDIYSSKHWTNHGWQTYLWCCVPDIGSGAGQSGHLHTPYFILQTHDRCCTLQHIYTRIYTYTSTHNVIIMPDLETCNVRGEAEQRATCLAWFLHNNLTKDYLYCNTRNWLWWTWTRLNWRIENWKHDGCHHPAQLAAYLSGLLWSMDSWRI